MTVPLRHNRFATERENINRLSNGGFTNYPSTLSTVDNTSATRNASIAYQATDVIDKKLYTKVPFSMTVPPEAGGENIVGYWDIYGAAGKVEISPEDGGLVQTTPAGGNLAKVTFQEDGEIVLAQQIDDLQPFRGLSGFALSGHSFTGDVQVTFTVEAGGSALVNQTWQAATFGAHKRVSGEVLIDDPADLWVKVTIKGCRGDSVGLSGITLILGPAGYSIPFTSSLADRQIPAGLVIMYTGEVCPQGYRLLEGTESAMAVVSGAGDHGKIIGNDLHDHNDTLIVEDLEHDTPPPPFGALNSILGIKFHDYPPGSAFAFTPFPGEVPVQTLGTNHTHRINSTMEGVPPTFGIRFCVKI